MNLHSLDALKALIPTMGHKKPITECSEPIQRLVLEKMYYGIQAGKQTHYQKA